MIAFNAYPKTVTLDDTLVQDLIDLYYECQDEGLEFESEYKGHVQRNVGVRDDFKGIVDDLPYHKKYSVLLHKSNVLPRIYPIVLDALGLHEDVDILHLNYPVFHLIDDPVLDGGEHRDLRIHGKEDIVDNLGKPKLFTAVVHLIKGEDGNLIFPEIEFGRLPTESGQMVVFNSATLHDIEPFEGERLSFTMQFTLEEGIMIHYV